MGLPQPSPLLPLLRHTPSSASKRNINPKRLIIALIHHRLARSPPRVCFSACKTQLLPTAFPLPATPSLLLQQTLSCPAPPRLLSDLPWGNIPAATSTRPLLEGRCSGRTKVFSKSITEHSGRRSPPPLRVNSGQTLKEQEKTSACPREGCHGPRVLLRSFTKISFLDAGRAPRGLGLDPAHFWRITLERKIHF